MTRETDPATLEALHYCALQALLNSGPDPGAAPGVNCSGKLWDEWSDLREEMVERGMFGPPVYPPGLRYNKPPGQTQPNQALTSK